MITAKFRRWNQEMDVEILNPGGWFGQTYLIEISHGYSSLLYAIEADSADDAVDGFAESKEGHLITAKAKDYAGFFQTGDDLMVHKLDPTQIRYHGADLPAKGVRADRYCQYQDWLAAR